MHHPSRRDEEPAQRQDTDQLRHDTADRNRDVDYRAGFGQCHARDRHLSDALPDSDTGNAGQAIHHHALGDHEAVMMKQASVSRKKRQSGSAMIEFVLAGVASATMLISTVTLCYAMWNYHTLAY